MDPLKDFGHFIAYYIPGVVTVLALLMFGSFVLNTNLLILDKDFWPIYTFIFLVGGSIVGLFIDELRHSGTDQKLESAWAKARGYEWKHGKMIDPLILSTKFGLDFYRQLLDEQFYFFEFDLNISKALFILGLCTPLYLFQIIYINNLFTLIGLPLVCILLSCCFDRFGRKVYEDYLDIVVDTMVYSVDEKFRKRISE